MELVASLGAAAPDRPALITVAGRSLSSAALAGATVVFGVPTVWSRIAADPTGAAALRPARLLVSGSAALPASVFHAIRAASGHGPVERYGMTETLITLSARVDRPRRPGWVGTPLADVETRIRDIDASTVTVGDQRVGDQRVGGPAVMAGYYRGAPGADFVAGDLARHKRPRRIELVAALPRNAMGKVDKRALPIR